MFPKEHIRHALRVPRKNYHEVHSGERVWTNCLHKLHEEGGQLVRRLLKQDVADMGDSKARSSALEHCHHWSEGRASLSTPSDSTSIWRTSRGSPNLGRFCPGSEVDGLIVLCGPWTTSSAESMRRRVLVGHEPCGREDQLGLKPSGSIP